MAAKERAKASFKEEEKEKVETRREFRERLQQTMQDGGTKDDGGSVFDSPPPEGSQGPVRHREKQTYTATDGTRRPAGGSSLSELKRAKERARKKM